MLLTMRQRDIYDFIRLYWERQRISPTIREISDHFSGLSQATVHQHLDALQAKGLIRKAHNRVRSIALLAVEPDAVAVPCEANGYRIPQGARFVPVESLDGLFAVWLRRRGVATV